VFQDPEKDGNPYLWRGRSVNENKKGVGKGTHKRKKKKRKKEENCLRSGSRGQFLLKSESEHRAIPIEDGSAIINKGRKDPQ